MFKPLLKYSGAVVFKQCQCVTLKELRHGIDDVSALFYELIAR